MGRGNLTGEEIRTLIENPYVEDVIGNRIIYADKFKLHFVNEYFSGKKPTQIFEEAGFEVKVLGNKRIERCSARWRELNAAGNLGEKYENNDFYLKHESYLRQLQKTIKAKDAEIEALKRQIAALKRKNTSA